MYFHLEDVLQVLARQDTQQRWMRTSPGGWEAAQIPSGQAGEDDFSLESAPAPEAGSFHSESAVLGLSRTLQGASSSITIYRTTPLG